MKNFIIIVISLVITSVSFSQTDISVWTKLNNDKQVSTFVWGTTNLPENFSLDYRWNFDRANAFGLLVGKGFTVAGKNSSLTVVPEIGIIYADGQSTDATVEAQAYGHIGSIVFFNFSQYTKNLNGASDFIFQYTEIGYKIGSIKAGMTGDWFYNIETKKGSNKFGPFVTIPVTKQIYTKMQINFSDEGKFANTLLAVGYTF